MGGRTTSLASKTTLHPAPVFVGREQAAAAVRAGLDDPACAVVVVRGPAGSGKTVLAEAALAGAAASGALTGSGKYVEGDAQPPFAPAMTALSHLLGEALDRQHDPEAVVASLEAAMGPALAALADAGFHSGGSHAHGAALPVIGRREAVARIIDACLRLVRWLRAFGSPMVVFIDDWRRGGADAHALYSALVFEARGADLTLLLAERDDTDGLAFPADAPVTQVALGPLDPAGRRALLRAVLGEAGDAVFDWFGAACPSLPFDLVAASRALQGSGAVRLADGAWRVDPALAAGLGRDDLARTLVASLGATDGDTRRVALAAALWGDEAPLTELAGALGMPAGRLESSLDAAAAHGVLERRGETIRFRHDRLRAAVLSAAHAPVAALAAGMSDRFIGPSAADTPAIRHTALRLRLIAGVETADAEVWRDRFASGAAAARLAMDIDAATAFAETAWRLRHRVSPPDVARDRSLLREAIMAAADRSDADAAIERIAALFQLAAGEDDVGDDYQIAIAALRLAGRPADAWRVACEGLAKLGLTLPAKVTMLDLIGPLARWRLRRFLARDRADETVADVPADALTKIGNAAATMAYERSPHMSALLALRCYERVGPDVRRLPLWLANDTFLSAMLGDFAGAARLGERAAKAASEPGFRGFAHAATLYRALYWGVIWRQPQASLRDRCRDIRDLAMAEGDLVQAAVALRNWVMIGWRTSRSLDDLARDIRQAQAELARLGDRDVHTFVSTLLAAVTSLTAPPSSEPTTDGRPDWARSVPHDNALLVIELASVHRDWRYTRQIVENTPAFRGNINSHPRGADWRLHDGLARLKTGEPMRRADMAYLERAARLNPADNRAKVLILRAEMSRVKGEGEACLAAYATAVANAEQGYSRLEAGVACECAAEAARAFGNTPLADHYDGRAQEIWAGWGARAKLIGHAGDAPIDGRPGDAHVGELADARAQALSAERVARARSRFLADVAHELRTPLQGMQGLIDLAADDPSRLDLPALRDVFVSLKTVVDDLTDFGALSSGETPIVPGSVAIVDLVRAECAVAEGFAREHGAVLEIDIGHDVPGSVWSDGPRIRQVLRNLLSNAAKYGGGRIIVTLARAATEASAAEDVVLMVEDEGPGLGAAGLVHIFEPFERGARAGDGKGLGLGLALSRRIALALGGTLRAQDRERGGARFTFRFPLSPAPATRATAPPARAVPALRILLAEDVPLVRRVIAAILEAQGHEVTEADDGVEAAALLGALDFDLAFLDLGMPGLDGLEVLERMTASGEGRARPPVVLLTASGDETITTRARAAGFAHVLRKPVSSDELRAVIALVHVSDTMPAPALEMSALREQAREDLGRRISALLQHPDHAIPAPDAHRLAGLAAQFGWPGIAAAADMVERASLSGEPAPPDALARFLLP
jgi:signal transduction histidine kinase/DNA-binding NarL/FixJ family response regulator